MPFASTPSNKTATRHASGLFVAVVIALAALAAAAAVWLWTSLQAVPVPLFGW